MVFRCRLFLPVPPLRGYALKPLHKPVERRLGLFDPSLPKIGRTALYGASMVFPASYSAAESQNRLPEG